VTAAVDNDGIQISKATIGQRSIRLAYVTPSHQFPTGVVLPLARRLELLNWASRVRAFVVEDDYDSEYRYDGPPLQALAGLDREGRVIYLGTFSKILFPALRLGYLVLPESLVEPITAAKAMGDTGTATLQQLALADFINEGQALFSAMHPCANVRSEKEFGVWPWRSYNVRECSGHNDQEALLENVEFDLFIPRCGRHAGAGAAGAGQSYPSDNHADQPQH